LRIDVEVWDDFVPEGVVVKIVNKIALHERQKAVFEITKGDFDRITRQLAAKHGGVPKKQKIEEAADDAVVEAQGFVLDSKTRKALEKYAMEAAKRYFTSLRYVVEDHSAGHPYDLLCTKKKDRLYIEVKGTQTNGDGIILTSGEVRFARRKKGQMALFLVHSINVSPNGKLSNGQVKVILPWNVAEGRLKPISFVYEVPTSQ
jgi:hypothetical protein